MAEEPLALSMAPAPAVQGDYEAICTAVMCSPRGRWFLEEYARRIGGADTRLALARIESTIGGEKIRQAYQNFRSELLEMAVAIARARTELVETDSEATAPANSSEPAGVAAAIPAAGSLDIMVAAERIRDVAWFMRERGFDSPICDRLDEVAASILTVAALRRPTHRRSQRLSEILQDLERRIGTMLEGSSDRLRPVLASTVEIAAPAEVTALPMRAVIDAHGTVAAASVAPAPPTLEAIAGAPASPPASGNPLAVLAAMSEDERIALFS
jgi:hypothetical protein